MINIKPGIEIHKKGEYKPHYDFCGCPRCKSVFKVPSEKWQKCDNIIYDKYIKCANEECEYDGRIYKPLNLTQRVKVFSMILILAAIVTTYIYCMINWTNGTINFTIGLCISFVLYTQFFASSRED